MIAVTSATGNIGLPLVRMLQGAKRPFRVLARDPLRAAKLLGPDVAIADAASPDALAGATKAFFLGHPGPELGAAAGAFATAAKAAGVAHVVAISSGTIDMNPPTTIGRWHLDLERALSASGVACTFLRPGNFASNALRWAPTIRAKSTVFAPKPDSASIPVDPRDIAAVAFASLVNDGHAGKTYSVQGPTVMTARTQVRIIAEELGRHIQVVEVSPEQALEGMTRAGLVLAMAQAVIELIGHSEPKPSGDVLHVTGVAPRQFAQWVKDHRDAFA